MSSYYIDYGYLGWVIKSEIHGSSVESCMDLPQKYWSRIPKCNPDLMELEELEALLREVEK